MNRSVKTATFLVGLLIAHGQTGASELKFGFQNPGFGGNPLATNFYLGMLESQKLIKEDERDPFSQDEDNLVESFAEGLKSRILSAIASKITQDIFGSDSTEGTFTIDNMLLDYKVVGDKVVINLTDGVTTTTIEIPRFDLSEGTNAALGKGFSEGVGSLGGPGLSAGMLQNP